MMYDPAVLCRAAFCWRHHGWLNLIGVGSIHITRWVIPEKYMGKD